MYIDKRSSNLINFGLDKRISLEVIFMVGGSPILYVCTILSVSFLYKMRTRGRAWGFIHFLRRY